MTAPHHSPVRLRSARRRLSAVLVDGLEPVGIRIAEQLIDLGIGTVLLRDDRPIRVPAAVGADNRRPRAEVHCRRLRSAAPRSAVFEAPENCSVLGLDLHVLISYGGINVAGLRAAFRNDSAVLPVEVSEAGFGVGPLLSQRAGRCPECLILYGVAEDLESDVSLRPDTAAELEPVVAGATVQQARLLVEGAGAAAATGLIFGVADSGTLGHRAVAGHPDCSCLADVRHSTVPAGARSAHGGIQRGSAQAVEFMP